MALIKQFSKKKLFLLVSTALFVLGVIFFSLAVQKYQVLTRSRADEPITCNGVAVGDCVGAKRCATNPADDGKFYNWCVKCGIDGNPESSEQGTGECCGNCGGPAPTGQQGACTDTTITTDEALCTAKCGGGYNSDDPNKCGATGGVSCGTGCAYFDPNNTSCGTCQGTNTAVWDGLCYKGEGTGKVTVHKGTAEDNSCPISANATEVSLSKDQCYTLSSSCEQADADGGGGVCVDTGCDSGGETTPTDTPNSTPTETVPSTPTSSPTGTPTKTPTVTPTQTPTSSPSATPTSTPTKTATPTPTSTPVPTATVAPTATNTPAPTVTPVPTNTPIPPTPTTVVIAQAPTATPTPVKQLTVDNQKPGITPWTLILVPIGLLLLGLLL